MTACVFVCASEKQSFALTIFVADQAEGQSAVTCRNTISHTEVVNISTTGETG